MNLDKALERATLDASLLEWMAVHGNLCLALRHPNNSGGSRALVAKVVDQISKLLVERGLLTQAEIDAATAVERPYGLEHIV
jgi:hypothetical protein